MPGSRDPDTSGALVIVAIPIVLLGLYMVIGVIVEVATKGWPVTGV